MPSLFPEWLSPTVSLTDFGGEAEKYIDYLFSVFEKDFIASKPIFNGMEVRFDSNNDGGRPAAFVHITTEEDGTGGRILSLRRCERIAWVRAIIENSNDPAVLVWKKEQKTKKRRAMRTYLFLEQEDFLVVLEEIRSGNFLITAIFIDYPHQKRKHLKDHASYKRVSS